MRAGLCVPWLPLITAGAACFNGDDMTVRTLVELLTCSEGSTARPTLTGVCSAEGDDVILGLVGDSRDFPTITADNLLLGLLPEVGENG